MFVEGEGRLVIHGLQSASAAPGADVARRPDRETKKQPAPFFDENCSLGIPFKNTTENLCILTRSLLFSRSQAEDLAICQRKSAGRGTLCKTRPQGCTTQVSDTHALHLLIRNLRNNATMPILTYDLIFACAASKTGLRGKGGYGSRKL